MRVGKKYQHLVNIAKHLSFGYGFPVVSSTYYYYDNNHSKARKRQRMGSVL